MGDKDQRKELDSMLSSLGVAPVAGKLPINFPKGFQNPKMADRKAELEKKRIKLQIMREEKERRRKEKELKDVEEAAGRSGAMGDKDQRKELDSMLSSLGVAPVA
ncbi:cytoplasmic dynein 1 intermediate chain-like, partial [Diaphorina citri]|uniref:Cytoplasmic dynein 1 intermediate chain-like n=1 Tax=Diaphorina citri TaxID=121845 RepID=A0A1S3DRA6_DIACI